MGFFNSLGSIASGIISQIPIVGDAFNAAKQYDYADQDYGLQREAFDLQRQAFEYQKYQNKLMQEREDNAVQRRIKDLRAAGLSPTLAAGNAAAASSATPLPAPDHKGSPPSVTSGKLSEVFSLMSMAQTLEAGRLDNDLRQLQVDNYNERFGLEKSKTQADVDLKKSQKGALDYNVEYGKRHGQPTGKAASMRTQGLQKLKETWKGDIDKDWLKYIDTVEALMMIIGG